MSKMTRAVTAVIGLVLSLPGVCSTQNSSSQQSEVRKTYFYSLEPGVTQEQIITAMGVPDTTYEGKSAYQMDQGAVTLSFAGNILISCQHHRPDAATLFSDLYTLRKSKGRAIPTKEEYERREQLLKQDAFYDSERWEGPSISTRRYAGTAYLLQNGYVVLETPVVLRGRSYASRVVRYRRGQQSEVLWRLYDHWAKVRPGNLTDANIVAREEALRRYGLSAEKNAMDTPPLGEPDGSFGSGILRQQYYIHDGLITTSDPPLAGGGITLWQPGAETQVSFEEWLKKQQDK